MKDRFLVPPFSRTVPIKFPRQGIAYDDLSDAEKELWDAIEWDEDGTTTPTRIESSALNSWLFNEDTVDKALAHLMTRGQHVAGGDRLSQTLIFANNHAHRQFITRRCNAHSPHPKITVSQS